MQFKAVLSNAQHPEYGVMTVPFPIPSEQYDEVIEMLHSVELGDSLKRDCHVDEISDDWPILKRLETSSVNIDELDYLAKRLDSFDTGEAAQFQGMGVKLGTSDMTDLINLTFCCQQATVITDFSDLNRIGRDHLLNLNGGSMPTAELDRADGRKTALELILNKEGTVTPYGVVYDNGMKLEQLYDGRHFPAYYYEPSTLVVEMTSKAEPENTKNITWLFLPMSQTQIERAMLRTGIDTYDDMRLRFDSSEMPDEVDVLLDFEHESLGSLNRMCEVISKFDSADMSKLAAAVLYAQPENADEITEIAKNLELFDYAPKVHSPEEYGRYMIQQSGHFDYDENLEDFYDYAAYGEARVREEQGTFNDRGYIAYRGTLPISELLQGDPAENHSFQIGGME